MYISLSADTAESTLNVATIIGAPVETGETLLPHRGKSPLRLVMCFVAGTSGLLTPDYLNSVAATSTWEINRVEIRSDHGYGAQAENAAAEKVAYIREQLHLSVTEIGRTLTVSRQAVHDWIKGKQLSLDNEQKLAHLYDLAAAFHGTGLEITPADLRRKVGGGKSVLETVSANGPAIEIAQQLIATLRRESDQRARLTERLGRRQVDASRNAVFGTPHLSEEV